MLVQALHQKEFEVEREPATPRTSATARRVVFPIIDDLSTAMGVDTEEEARELAARLDHIDHEQALPGESDDVFF